MSRAVKTRVANRGIPPDEFLSTLVAWGAQAPAEIFDRNKVQREIYTNVLPNLGPWEGAPGSPEFILHRRAVMLEVLRVLAGFESSWRWNEGVDVTNRRSQAHVEGQEAGAFQVSYDSLGFGNLREWMRSQIGEVTPREFIKVQKQFHPLACEYAARLLRFTVAHNGPVLRREINPWLQRAAVQEFKALLSEAA